ncbi:hypothetical protein [Selenomonas ruminantium]|jgi:hypothetical protein|uniref:Uncharacterized protein n=1 Tax=Selenomonas ruminantium TaxID=971 RepID=A0A1I0VH47_SELRU|nr:hypothetical protein [Selenomonas ruminantium]SFA75704.1 hypothetical protein SAMN05216587_101613 [Selenomonas ruminantium]
MNPLQMMQQFNQFRQNWLQQNPNTSPQQAVQQLLNSGKMSQQQFEQFRKIANGFSGMKM